MLRHSLPARKRALTWKPNWLTPWSWTSQPSEPLKKKKENSYSVSHLFYAILLWQPELTNALALITCTADKWTTHSCIHSFVHSNTLGPILSPKESVVNKDELKFLPYGSKSCERESINWMTLETQIIWISCGDTCHKGEVLGVCCRRSWRKHRGRKGLKRDGAAESQEGRGLWYLLRRGMGRDRQSELGGNVKERF